MYLKNRRETLQEKCRQECQVFYIILFSTLPRVYPLLCLVHSSSQAEVPRGTSDTHPLQVTHGLQCLSSSPVFWNSFLSLLEVSVCTSCSWLKSHVLVTCPAGHGERQVHSVLMLKNQVGRCELISPTGQPSSSLNRRGLHEKAGTPRNPGVKD